MSNFFKNNELDTITDNTPFIKMAFYKWLESHYCENLANWPLVSIYQYLGTLGFIQGKHRLEQKQYRYLKNCFEHYAFQNQGKAPRVRTHELRNMLEHSIEGWEGSFYLSNDSFNAGLKTGWYIPTGALKLTLDNYPSLFGNVNGKEHYLRITNGTNGTNCYYLQIGHHHIISKTNVYLDKIKSGIPTTKVCRIYN